MNKGIMSIEEHLIKSIKARLDEVAKEEVEKCKERIQQRIAEYASGTAIKLMERVRIDRKENEFVISIEMPKVKP